MVKAQENIPEIQIWPNGAAESNCVTALEKTSNNVKAFGKTLNGIIENISEGSFSVYQADKTKNTGAAVLICPGGAYMVQASQSEGILFAKWCAENGITGIVLKYRLPNGHPEIPLKDAQEAIRIVRKHATEWNINPDKIGISGFSAGGHLASLLLTHFNDTSRADFGILFYPLTSLEGKSDALAGLRKILLGKDAENKAKIDYYSSEKQVQYNSPPTIIFQSDDDQIVIPENSILFYQALKQKSIPASLHIFPEGGHGWGFEKDFSYYDQLKRLILDWLGHQKII